MLFDNIEHGIVQADFCLPSLHSTSVDDGYSSMNQICEPIGFNNHSEITADQSDVSNASANGLSDLVVWWFIGVIVILTLPLIRDMQDFHSRVSSMSCLTGLCQCCCLADFYKKKCHYSQSMRHQRSNQILSMLCLCVLLLQPMANGSAVTPSFEANAVGMSRVQNKHIDTSQLANGTDFSNPQQLRQLFQAMVTKLDMVEKENVELRSESSNMQSQIDDLQKDALTSDMQSQIDDLQKDTLTSDMQSQIDELQYDKSILENKTQLIEMENTALKKRVTSLESIVVQLADKTATDTEVVNADLESISVRLDQCEQDSFGQILNRRRNQEQSSACGLDAVQSMLAVCCSSGPLGSGHRRVQADGCDSLPPTCSLECSSQFISIFENCQGQPVLEQLPPGQLARWTGFLGQCQEVQQGAAQMGVLQPVNVRMFRIHVSSDAAQSHQVYNTVGQPIIAGPNLELLSPPTAPSDSGSTEVREYHAQCNRSNIMTCVPACNATHHGYELLANIDGTDTKFSCNLANMLFSWVGAAALGGYLGRDVATFVSAVISGAAGTYVLTLAEDANVGTDLVIQPGQNVIISGDPSLVEAPIWGDAFSVAEGAKLTLEGLAINVAMAVAASADLTLHSVTLHSSACIGIEAGGRLLLVKTPTPQVCLVNVIIDTDDIASCVASLGSGLPGTYVLRLAGQAVEISVLDLLARQELHIINTAMSSLMVGLITAAPGAALTIGGNVLSLDIQGAVTLAENVALTIAGEVGLTVRTVAALVSVAEGSISFQGDSIGVVHTGGARCGGIVGNVPGAVALGLSGLAPIEFPSMMLRMGQELHVTCTAVGSLALGAITLAAGARLIVGGDAAMTPDGLASTLAFAGNGSVAFDGMVTLVSLAGAPAGTVIGGLPGMVTLDLAAPLVPGGAMGAHSTDKAGLGPFLATCVLERWNSGNEVTAAGEDLVGTGGVAFTLVKLPPQHASFCDSNGGPARYMALCQAYGMVGFGDGAAHSYCDAIISHGGLCMPLSWSYPIANALHTKTGWTRIVFFGDGYHMCGLDEDGGYMHMYHPGDYRGYIFCPVCALAHDLSGRRLLVDQIDKAKIQAHQHIDTIRTVSDQRRVQETQKQHSSLMKDDDNNGGRHANANHDMKSVDSMHLMDLGQNRVSEKESNEKKALSRGVGLVVLDIDPALRQFFTAVVTELHEVKNELKVMKNENVAFQNMTMVREAEVKHVKKDKEALQNKTQIIEGELVKEKKKRTKLLIEVREVRSALYQFSNKTNTDYTHITVRLDQCEANTHPFIKEMQASHRRRLQEEETLCRGSGMIAMFAACCPSQAGDGGHRRFLQSVQGCDALPETCSASCAPLFIEYFEGCQGTIDDLEPEQRQIFVGFYGGCQEAEQAAAAMLQDAQPAMIFHVVVLNEAAAQQAQMFSGGSAPPPPIGSIGPLPPSPSPPGGAEIAQEFRRVCTTANLTVCVPQCNRLTYGFLLSIEIDGRGTVMTCNKVGVMFSWQGQASLGGYIGSDTSAFFSSVVSGAAGTYLTTLVEDVEIGTDLTIRAGQNVVVSGELMDGSSCPPPPPSSELTMGGTSYPVQVRIDGGGPRGVLQLNINNQGWGAVCDDIFDSNTNAAIAFCATLGYSGGTQYDTTHGSDEFAADDITCPNGASSISECSSSRVPYTDNCGDSETVGIYCNVRRRLQSNRGRDSGLGSTTSCLPAWGEGGFAVEQFGSLALSRVRLAAALSVTGGGSLALSSCELSETVHIALTGRASLAVEQMQLATPLSVPSGGSLALSGCELAATALVTVTGDGSVSLQSCTGEIEAALAIITMTGGGSLSLGNLALPAQALVTALVGLAGARSWLALDAVTVVERPDWGALTGTVTWAGDREPPHYDPPNLGRASLPTFTVTSGPCTLSENGRCVGRWPGGYGPNEDCVITVVSSGGGAAGGVLAGCPVFDTNSGDYLAFPDGSLHGYARPTPTARVCPTGAVLAASESMVWHSDSTNQGHNGNGLLQSNHGLGGGWQICFA
eukprot:SAG22_NODE_172_length_16609_cov_14.370806_2_plen_2010_part_00